MPRVLLLDDDLDFVDSLKPVLEGYGHEVAGARSIEEAYRLARSQQFDVMLLDIMMPPINGMNREAVSHGRETGWEVARQVRVIDPGLPILVLSVVTDASVLEKLRMLGNVHFLRKPREMAEITGALSRVARTPE